MKKTIKRAICLIVAFLLCTSMLQGVAVFAAPSTNYTLTGDQAKDVVAVAKAQTGKSKEDFGWTVDWCAYFVCWAERTAGAFSIPNLGSAKDIAKWFVDNNKGTFYYFRDANYNSLLDVGIANKNLCVKSSRSSFVPQKGDLICYLWTEDVGTWNWSHVGIVDSYNASTGVIKTVEGNTTSSYIVASRNRDYDSTVVGFVRPNYKNSNPLSVTFQSSSVSLNPGQQISVPFTLKGDGIYTYEAVSDNGNVCQVTGYDPNMDWNTGKGAFHIKGVAPGSTNITFRLKDENYNILFSKKLPITVNDYTGKLVASTNSLTLDLASSPSKSINVSYNGGTLPSGFGNYKWSYDTSIISVTNAGGGEFVVTGLKKGTTQLNFDIVTATGDNYYLDGRASITVTVTAPSYTVSYNANGGSGAPSSQTKSYGSALTLSSVKPTRSGYVFKGWSTTSNGSVQYQPGSQYTVDKSTTLYAVWAVAEYTGKLIVTQNTYVIHSLSLDMVNNPTETIHVGFDGGTIPEGFNYYTWYLSSPDGSSHAGIRRLGNGEFSVEAIAEGTTNIIFDVVDSNGQNCYEKGRAVLEVTVSAPSYTVKYNANGGSGAPASQIKKYDKILTLSSTKPTRTGYTFKGWSTSANGSVQYQSGGSYTANQAVTLYAVWEKNVCSHSWGPWIKYDGNQHKRECQLCTVFNYGAHDWDEGVITQPPTATSTGIRTYSCLKCEATKTQSIPKNIAVSSVSLNKTTASMEVGETLTLTATVAPSNAANKAVTWATSNAGVATVQNGVVTAHKTGTVTISATAQDGSGKLATCKITIKSSADENLPTLTVTDAKAGPGDEVEVSIKIENNTGIAGMTLKLSYPKQFTLIDIAERDGLPTLEYTPPGNYSANPVSLNWDGLDADNSNGVILTLTFRVAEGTPEGEYPFSLSYRSGDVYDGDMEDMDLNLVVGTVTVRDIMPGDANGDNIINGKDVTMIRRYLAGGYDMSDFVFLGADTNEDGIVNGKDATMIRRYLAGGYGIVLG